MKIVIVVEGGIVSHVLTEKPTDIIIVDYDVDGSDPEELTPIVQDDGRVESARLYIEPSNHSDPERVADIFKLYDHKTTGE